MISGADTRSATNDAVPQLNDIVFKPDEAVLGENEPCWEQMVCAAAACGNVLESVHLCVNAMMGQKCLLFVRFLHARGALDSITTTRRQLKLHRQARMLTFEVNQELAGAGECCATWGADARRIAEEQDGRSNRGP